MSAHTKTTEQKPAPCKSAVLVVILVVPFIAAACTPQPAGRPREGALPALRLAAGLPHAATPMKILMTPTGDVPNAPVNGNDQPLQDSPVYPSYKDHTYGFGTAGSGTDVCFWDQARPNRQFCWPNTTSAWIFLNPQGDVTHAQQASGTPIPSADRNATAAKSWYYGHGTPYCFWTDFGGCYCWDV